MVSDSLGVQYVPSFFCLRNAPACVILIRSTFAFEPVSEARGVGNISPHDKSSLAFMPRADGASRKYECPNCISRLFQVKERFVEPHIDEVSNIFAKHPTGAQFFNDAAHFRPEITGVGKSLFRADCGERLAGEAPGDKSDCFLSCFFNKSLLCYGCNILKARHIRPVSFKHFVGVFRPFALADGRKPRRFCGKVNPANPGKQAEMR